MPNEQKYTRANFNEEEGKEIIKEIDLILAKFNAEFVVTPFISEHGTINAKLELFKKVEIKQESTEEVKTPYLDETTTETTEVN